MRYLALACDYDGTLAFGGRVSDDTVSALRRLRLSGRKLVLVTGRELDDLLQVFSEIELCDLVVAENGAVVYRPATREEHRLGDAPPEQLVQELKTRGVPLSVGRVIVATWQPHETTVLEAIRDLGLERQVIFNKGAVMILPSGVNKATGLAAALAEMELTAHNAVGIGDAENDHAFLRLCECAVAVANALPMLKEAADLVTEGHHGAGVIELIEALLQNDLQNIETKLTRHHILLGTATGKGGVSAPPGWAGVMGKGGVSWEEKPVSAGVGWAGEITIPPYGANLLLAGTSGSGKSTLATGLLERMADRGYQFCVMDPEGDYQALNGAVAIGDKQRAPSVDEVIQLLRKPAANVVVNLVGMAFEDRPAFLRALMPRLHELRTRTGRPHWLILDEAHHVLPAEWRPPLGLPEQLAPLLLITVHPREVAAAAVALVNLVIAVGDHPETTLREAGALLGREPVGISDLPASLPSGEAVCWDTSERPPVQVHIAPCRTERLRHRRKYAEGDLGAERSFYFTGRERKLNLRAHNLMMFIQIAEGVDDETWTYHLRRGEYSQWFREAIKDDALAAEAERIEQQDQYAAAESRHLVKNLITTHYTSPVSSPAPLGVEVAGRAVRS